MSTQTPTEFLFSYGTLQIETVQIATFGRQLAGISDALLGFEQSRVEIEDQAVVKTSGNTHHPIIRFTGKTSDIVFGTAFTVTSEEINNADKYEVAAYKRISVSLRSGIRAWVYIDVQYAAPPDL